MAEAGSWDSIRKHGLLSTTALLDLFEITGSRRFKLESEWRPESVAIHHPILGRAVIRDQKPMPPSELQNCLDGLTPRQWYEMLNRKTFFWVEEKRLITLLNAFAYRNRAHCVIAVDTRALLDNHADRVTLSSINSGFVYYGGTRGQATFRAIEDFPSGRTVWELAVEHSVPDIAELTLRVTERKGDRELRVIWERQ